jgi:hypothetical protein
VLKNRLRARGKKGKKLQRMRSEQVKRTYPHVLETGGGRCCRLRGKEKIQKRYHLMTAAYNLEVHHAQAVRNWYFEKPKGDVAGDFRPFFGWL